MLLPYQKSECTQVVDCFIAGVCTVDQFQCFNRQCVDRTQRCDGVWNCQDKTDELECRKMLRSVENLGLLVHVQFYYPVSLCSYIIYGFNTNFITL